MQTFNYAGYFEKVAAEVNNLVARVGKSTLPNGKTTELPGKLINAYHSNPKTRKGLGAAAAGAAALFAGNKARNIIKAKQNAARMTGIGIGAAGGVAAGGAIGYGLGSKNDDKSTKVKQASIDYSGRFDELFTKEAAAGVVGKSTVKLFGSTFTSDAPGKVMRFAQSNPAKALGYAAGAGALGTWAAKK